MYEPQNFDEFIGQDLVKDQIKVVLDYAKLKKLPLAHMIFYGPPGLGKTAMGKLLAKEMNTKLIYAVGNTVEPLKDLILLEEKDIYFIDELHRLRPAVEEILYNPLTDYILFDNSGIYNTPQKLEHFTFIGATTTLGKVSKPLRDRASLNLQFRPYDINSLFRIVEQAARRCDIPLVDEGIELIAKIARGVPRVALHTLDMCQKYIATNHILEGTLRDVKRVLQLLEISEDGLTSEDVRYMNLLKESNRPVGINAIATRLGVDNKTVVDVVEPYLIENEFVLITTNGRVLTKKGLRRVTE